MKIKSVIPAYKRSNDIKSSLSVSMLDACKCTGNDSC